MLGVHLGSQIRVKKSYLRIKKCAKIEEKEIEMADKRTTVKIPSKLHELVRERSTVDNISELLVKSVMKVLGLARLSRNIQGKLVWKDHEDVHLKKFGEIEYDKDLDNNFDFIDCLEHDLEEEK